MSTWNAQEMEDAARENRTVRRPSTTCSVADGYRRSHRNTSTSPIRSYIRSPPPPKALSLRHPTSLRSTLQG